MRRRAAASGLVSAGVVAVVVIGAVLAATRHRPPTRVAAAASPPATSRTSATTRGPGTASVSAPCRDPRPVVAPVSFPTSSPVEFPIAVAQSLESTIGQVTAYGRRHPESFGEVRLDGDRVVATFVGDLAAHAAALSTLVDRPAAVIVCPATLSAVEGQTVANEILAESNSAMLSIGIGADGRVDVQVRADHRDTADSLLRRHGPKVRVTLGQLPYPDINSAPQQRCPDLPTAAAVNDALHWTVEPDVLRVNSGGDLTIRVSWTNTGSKPVTYESGDPITGLVTRVGSTHVVAVYAGAIAGVGHGGTLEPGATDAVSAFVSTGSCDPTIGWALPAGTYDVYFPFGGFDFTATGGMRADQFVSTPFILTITDEPAPPLATRPPGPPLTFPAPRNTFG